MTLSQLEYLIIVAEVGHFGHAAEKLPVTQPTLSMMIKKLEEELGVILLDRTKKPIVPTKVGEAIIRQGKHVLAEANYLKDLVYEFSYELKGTYKLGVIPTIAPYLVPKLIDVFMKEYQEIQLQIQEGQTADMIEALKEGELDAAIMATPINDNLLDELPLFYEEFFAFGKWQHEPEHLITPNDIKQEELWLLEEGHCLRTQVINLCDLKKDEPKQFQYNSGSLETLIQIVKHHKGLTIVPELTAKTLSETEQIKLKAFHHPAPFREMSLVLHKRSAKFKFVEAIQDAIEEIIPLEMRKLKKEARILKIK